MIECAGNARHHQCLHAAAGPRAIICPLAFTIDELAGIPAVGQFARAGTLTGRPVHSRAPTVWSSASEDRAAPGSEVTAVSIGNGRFALYLGDPSGGGYTASGNAATG